MDTTKLPSAIKGILERRRRARVTFMLSKVALSERPNVIDIGCGISGRSFEDYVPEDWRILGVDVVPEHRVQHTHPGFTYRREDAQHLECFGDREFDLAVSVGMLEHITEEPTFSRIVAQIRRVARQYIVVVPDRDLVLVRLGKTPAELRPNLVAVLASIIDEFPVRPLPADLR